MPRLLSTLLVVALLGGTATAFAVTERLKLVPTPIVAPQLTEAFSPVCGCPTNHARIEFTLREPDRLTVTIVAESGEPMGVVADGEQHPAGAASFSWSGGAAPEGLYRARVQLAEQRRTIVIPNQMRLDTTPPELTVESVEPRVFSPDADGRADRVRVTYSVSERSRVHLLVNGERAVETPLRGDARLEWYGRELPPGTYELTLVAEDAAGNRSEPSAPVAVRLRFIELAPAQIIVPAGARFGVRVSTDAERWTWRLGARRGSRSGETLELRAPQQPGRYTLRVGYGDREAAIPVFVRERP